MRTAASTIDGRLRRLGRHEGGEPGGEVVALHAGLRHGRKLRSKRAAPGRRDRKARRLAGLHLRQRRRDVGEDDVDLPAEEIGDGLRVALVCAASWSAWAGASGGDDTFLGEARQHLVNRRTAHIEDFGHSLLGFQRRSWGKLREPVE
jgi:hypothetical protein